MGDFNIDMKVNNYIQGKLIRVMNSVGLKQLVREPTRIVNTSATIIDLFFSNMDMEVEICHEPKIMDHSAIILYWNNNIILAENNDKVIVRRNYKRMDEEEFKRLISIHLNAIEGESVNVLATLAINEIVACLDLTAPQRAITLRRRGKQWYSQHIYQLMKQRDMAYKRARLGNNIKDWELFRQMRNKTVDECRKAKRDYLKEKLDKNKRNPKQMWIMLKEILKGNLNSREYSELQCSNKIISKVDEMVERFNCYFVDSIKLLTNVDYEEKYIENRQYIDKVFDVFKKVEIEQVYSIIRKLGNKSGTEEGITVKIMKLVVEAAGEKVWHILNMSLEEGMFPVGWKEAIVVPIPKIRGTNKIEEFRPVNKLPIYEKVLETIVHRQLAEYLENNDLLKECQSGFRAKDSCETALQCVISDWKKTIGEEKMIEVVFLDLRRAFEVVNREILIN